MDSGGEEDAAEAGSEEEAVVEAVSVEEEAGVEAAAVAGSSVDEAVAAAVEGEVAADGDKEITLLQPYLSLFVLVRRG